jgi:hypothetical protein
MTEDDLDNLLNHPLMPTVWTAVRLASHHFSGIAEVKSLDAIVAEGSQYSAIGRPTDADWLKSRIEAGDTDPYGTRRRELRQQWANQGLYEGGIDWEAPEPPSGDAGLTVVELKDA